MEYGIKIMPKIYESDGHVYLDLSKYDNYIKDGDRLEIYDFTLEELENKNFNLAYKVEISIQDYGSDGNFTCDINRDRTEYIYEFEDSGKVLDEAIYFLDDIKFSNAEIINDTNELHELTLAVLMEDEKFGFIDLTHHCDGYIEPQIFYQKNTIATDFEDFISDSRQRFGEVKLDEETLKYAITHNKVKYLTSDEILDCVYKLDEYSIAELLECAIENNQLNNLTMDVVKTCLDVLDNDRISEIENIDELYVVYPQLIPHKELEM